jgi:carbon monoxide dehydrogenase subunit G
VQLSHSFTVPASVERTWQTFMDLELVGNCFPGATVTEVTDEGFTGNVKVKLGPIALLYTGLGSFVERDDTAYRAVIDAKGKDKRGNGTAGAMVTIQLTGEGDGSTRADVATDLSVTGKPAQFGRGVMQDVSDKLLQQFTACIEGRLTGGPTESDVAAGVAQAAEAEEAAGAAGTAGRVGAVRSAGPVAAAGPTAASAGASAGASAESRAPATAPTGTTGPRETTKPIGTTSDVHRADDAIDLGSTVLPVLLKNYGKQALGVVAVVLAAIAVYRWLKR